MPVVNDPYIVSFNDEEAYLCGWKYVAGGGVRFLLYEPYEGWKSIFGKKWKLVWDIRTAYCQDAIARALPKEIKDAYRTAAVEFREWRNEWRRERGLS